MHLRPLFRSLVLACGLWGAAAQGQTHDVGLTSLPGGSLFGSFLATHATAGALSDVDSFSFTGGPFSIGLGRANELPFASASLKGVPYSFADLGAIEFGGLAPTGLSGALVRAVNGSTGPRLGEGQRVAAGYAGALSVSPVPEPGTYAMMLAGLGALAFMVRRRRPSA